VLRRTTWRRLGVLGSALGDGARVHLEISWRRGIGALGNGSREWDGSAGSRVTELAGDRRSHVTVG
jgi:hypothetical protein